MEIVGMENLFEEIFNNIFKYNYYLANIFNHYIKKKLNSNFSIIIFL